MTSWAKITWHGKKKRKKIIIMTISKDNKWMVLSLLKVKDDKLFHKKRHENYKV